MNNEQRTKELAKKNGYCDCPELQELYLLRREADGIAEACNFYRSWLGNLDKVDEEQLKNLNVYKENVKNLRHARSKYNSALALKHQNGELKAIVRGESGGGELEVELWQIPSVQKKKTITFHCARCKQQIDFLSND